MGPAFDGYFCEKSAERLLLFRDDVEKQLLQDFLGYVMKKKVESYVKGAKMQISMLYAWMATVIRYLVKNNIHGGYRHKRSVHTYKRISQKTEKQ